MKTLQTIPALILCAIVAVSAQSQTILLDLGNSSSFRGADVTSPDGNGNYWNSVWSGAFYTDIDDINGNATDVDFGFSGEAGTDYFNGPSGATQDPTATVYNAAALGNLGVDEAVYDYYVNPQFEIQGLDPAKTYDLTFYGSHKFNSNPTTLIEVYSDDTYTTLVDSATIDVHQAGSPWLHNEDTTATISGLTPQAFNILYVRVSSPFGGDGFGYLNAMQIDGVIPEPSSFLLACGFGLALAVRRR